MAPIAVSITVLACTFGSALLGMHLRNVLPKHHLDAESKDTVKLGIGLVATMTALLLGLIIASAKDSFDAVDTGLKQTSAQILALDRALARYGPETTEIRNTLQRDVGARIEAIWFRASRTPADLDPIYSGATFQAEGLAHAIRGLTPGDDSQRALQSRALDLSEALLQARWLVFAGAAASIPAVFLVILVWWLTISFLSFGLFAPRNVTVIVMLFVCATAVSSAVFLVLELAGPFEGVLRVSADPLNYAYAHLNR